MHIQQLKDKPPSFLAALVFLTLVPLYYVSYQYRLTHPYGGHEPARDNVFSSTDFVRDWLSTHVVSPFNPSALATYCNRTEWRPNLVFNLENANGGIGNVRGNTLDFLFFAIEAGASIILPGRATRSQEDISNVWAARAPFDSFFDEEWFMYNMAHSCPQMSIYKPEKHHKMVAPLPGNYLPHSRRIDSDVGNTKQAYLTHLSAWLADNPSFSAENLTLVNLERTLWDIDTRSLPMGFRRNFGQLLRINPTIRRLAGIVVLNLALTFRHNINPTAPIPRQAFYGAHLRTEADAQGAGWLNDAYSNFSAQTDAYIAQALHHKLKTIYVATGNSSDLERFRTKAATHRPPLNITSKFDLLPPNEAAALRELTWDQQALVDYEVLQRCSVFSGIVKSSFSYNVAMTRGQVLEDEGRVVDPWAVMHSEEGVAFDDGVSRILGRDGWHEQRIPRGMWP
ncbi:uncharacterized protein LTR77_003576 [Saxophila tyrrhenica]|uniref:Alternative oxidase n=1 Tax=Saxophila tyrrhenica TaxID=1690608 RepID=A0AAV9PIC3_9PEZI|nr:hypothetical protein LTR77_003576 [Saxophila tyrrhenica]